MSVTRTSSPANLRSPEAATNDRASADSRTAPAPSPAEQSTPGRRHWRGLVVALAVAAALGGAVWYILAQDGEEQAQLVLQGNIDVRQVNLSFKVDGRIEKLLVDEGDTVKAGQVLATLDQRYFQDDLRLARARRDNAAANLARLEHGSRPEEIAQARAQTADREATMARAKADFARAKELIGMGGISREDYDLRQTAVQVAEAQVRSAREAQRLVEIGPRQEDIDAARAQLAEQEAALIQSQRRLADADLVAPNDGVILTRARERARSSRPARRSSP